MEYYGESDRKPESNPAEAFGRSPCRASEQADPAHPRQTAATQDLRRAVESPEPGPEPGEASRPMLSTTS